MDAAFICSEIVERVRGMVESELREAIYPKELGKLIPSSSTIQLIAGGEAAERERFA